MEKTLREELEDAFDIARTEGMLHSKDGKHSLSSEADAEGIIEFISQRIKAKALTDEQIENALIKYGVVEVHHITSKSQIAKYQVIMKAFQEAILEDLK